MKQHKFYGRPAGSHIHTSLDCPMLAGAVFKELGYEEITLEEAQKRELSLCSCVAKTFGLEKYLSIDGFIKNLVGRRD